MPPRIIHTCCAFMVIYTTCMGPSWLRLPTYLMSLTVNLSWLLGPPYMAFYNVQTIDVQSSPSTGEVWYRSPTSDLEYQCSKTNQSPGGYVWGLPRGPPSITKHRCVMSEVSLWIDDRGMVRTQFEISMMGELSFFLGLQVKQSK